MRVILAIVKLYLAIGLVLGCILFASLTVHSAMSVPPKDELATDAAAAAMAGAIRTVNWAPDAYLRLVENGEQPLDWFLYRAARVPQTGT